MKKLLTILLALTLMFALTACGGDNTATEEENTETSTSEPAEPLNPTPGSVTIGDVTLTAELVQLPEPVEAASSGQIGMAVAGDKVYIGDGDQTVKVYTIADNALTLAKEMTIENRGGISLDKDGRIYADGGVFPAKIYDGDGNQVGEAAEKGEIVMSQTKDFGLTYFTGDDAITKIAGGAAAPWVISCLTSDDPTQRKGPFSDVKAFDIVGDHVLVVGSVDGDQILAVYDTDGNQLLKGTDGLSGNGISALTETANGYMTASVSQIHLTAKDGTFIGYASTATDLFGLENAYLEKFVAMPDGSVLALCKSYRADDIPEILVYKITGF